jgi:hypothetical protein
VGWLPFLRLAVVRVWAENASQPYTGHTGYTGRYRQCLRKQVQALLAWPESSQRGTPGLDRLPVAYGRCVSRY